MVTALDVVLACVAVGAGILFLQLHHACLVMYRVIEGLNHRQDALDERISRLEGQMRRDAFLEQAAKTMGRPPL